MKKIIAILLSLSILFALAACGSKDAQESTTLEDTSVTDLTEEISDETDLTDTTEITETNVTEITEITTDETETTQGEAEESTEPAKAPETTAEIIKAYNDAVNSAFKAKAGFSKERNTDNEKYDMGAALKVFKSLVEKFIGIGPDNRYSEEVKKGQWEDDAKKHYLRQSTISAGDITAATVKTEGKNYIVTLSIKDGNSHGSKDSKYTNAPVDKCGICVGNEDKGYYDHKTGEVIYDAVGGTYAGADIKESYSNAKAVAKIDIETGKLVALTVEYDISVAIDIGIGKGTATGTTHIIYKDFKY